MIQKRKVRKGKVHIRRNRWIAVGLAASLAILQTCPYHIAQAEDLPGKKAEAGSKEEIIINDTYADYTLEREEPLKEVLETEDGKVQYLISTETEKKYDKLKDRFEKDLVEKGQEGEALLEEEGILVAAISQEEAEKLDEQKNVEVEPDILLNGSSISTGTAVEAEASKENVKEVEAIQQVAEEQWNVNAVHCEEEGEKEGQDSIRVAVLDSGRDGTSSIPYAGSVNFVAPEIDSHGEDMTGHGTAVAGIIQSGENETGVPGLLSSDSAIELYSVKVLDGNNQAPVSRIVEGIQWCIDNDIQIINMSFGMKQYSGALEEIIVKAYEAGILLVSSVGNAGEEADGAVEYPAAFPQVIGVGSVNQEMKRSSFSVTGEEVELMAPGENVPVNSFWGFYGIDSGTSYAAPHITAVAAKLWSLDDTKSAEFIRSLMQTSARELGEQKEYGYGLVDYQYAREIYQEFAEGYTEHSLYADMESFENAAKIETYEVPEMVQANWSHKADEEGHYCMTGKAVTTSDYETYLSLISSNALKVLKGASRIPDYKNILAYTVEKSVETIDLSIMDRLHGRPKTNYVGSVVELMQIALEQRTVSDCTEATKNAYKVAKGTLCYRWIPYYEENKSYTFAVNDAATTNLQMLGIAMHVIGDAYAHLSMVPSYLFDSNITVAYPSEAEIIKARNIINTQIYEGNIKSSVIKGIKKGKVCTAGISKAYYTSEKGRQTAHKVTADNVKFLPERYSMGTFFGSSQALHVYFHSKNPWDAVYCFAPELAHVYGWISYEYPYAFHGLEDRLRVLGYTFANFPVLSVSQWNRINYPEPNWQKVI